MSYKTILVHVDESARAGERIKIAAAVAMAHQAHLIGTAVTGASRYLLQARLHADADPHLRSHLNVLRTRAEQGLSDFDVAVRKLDLASHETRLVDDEAGGGICLQARYADLVVIGQNDPAEALPVVLPDFPQYVVLHSGRPVLIVPHAGRFDTIGKDVLIAWDACLPAARAVAAAIPMLQRANKVRVALFNPGAQAQSAGAQSTDIAIYLARHGIKADLLQRETGDVGSALLALVAETHSDLLIMGAYAHGRFRDIVLGNVTRAVLHSMIAPVLMAH